MLRSPAMAKKRKKKLTAKTADRHVLYQLTVQNADFEVELAEQYFKKRVGRRALSLREDFCGTALLCAEWVKSDDERTATGVDIDQDVLTWGKKHNIEPLGDAASRVTLLEEDVRNHGGSRHDVVMALNYSYFYFKDRDTVRRYFETVKEHLKEDGLFFLDLFGGYESTQVLAEKRKYPGFTYVWHQAAFNPIDNHFLGHIHFRFKDGTALNKAFTYDWRLWTAPELRELLAEAGYAHVEVLWEKEDDEGEGTGEFVPRTKVDNDPGFNAYLLASVKEPARLRQKREKKEQRAREKAERERDDAPDSEG